MKTRIITGFCMGVIGIPLLIFAPVEVFIGLSLLLSAVATYELIRMFDSKNEVKMSFISKVTIYTLVLYENLSISLTWYFIKKGYEMEM